MATLIITVAIASLLGSLHCAGMCGAFAAFAVGTNDAARAPRVLLHVLYHGGRLLTYSALGAACGLLGAMIDLGGAEVGLQRLAAFLAGGTMILVGAIAVARYAGVRLPHVASNGPFQKLTVIGHKAAVGFHPTTRAATIGLLSTFLPCGWLYAFAITAAGTASPLWGAAVMAAFWVGTVPVLLSIGVGVQALSGWLGQRVPLVMSLAIIGLGLYTIAQRNPLPFDALESSAHAATTQQDAVARVKALDAHEAPCCQRHGE